MTSRDEYTIKSKIYKDRYSYRTTIPKFVVQTLKLQGNERLAWGIAGFNKLVVVIVRE